MRIVCLVPSLTEYLSALGLEEEVVCIRRNGLKTKAEWGAPKK